MELPIFTDEDFVIVAEVVGWVTDRRTDEKEKITFYRIASSKEDAGEKIKKALEPYGYDFEVALTEKGTGRAVNKVPRVINAKELYEQEIDPVTEEPAEQGETYEPEEPLEK